MNYANTSDIIQLKGCSKGKTYRTMENSSRNTDVALQHIAKQNAFVLFIGASNISTIRSSDEIANLIESVKNTPYPIRERVQNYQREPLKISLNIASIATNWLRDCIIRPKQFSRAIVDFFKENPQDLMYFALVVYPSMYRHFIFYETQHEAMKLITEILRLENDEISVYFVFTFVLLDGNFFKEAWNTYDAAVSQMTPPLSQSNTFRILIKSFSQAFNVLSEEQQKVMIMFADTNKELFAKMFFQKIAVASFIIMHKDITIKENNKMVEILHFIGENPNSPHFNIFYNAMMKKTSYNCPIKQSDTFAGQSATLILSFRDLYILQQVIMKSPGLSIQYDKNLLIPSSFEWIVEALTVDLTLDFIKDSPTSSNTIISTGITPNIVIGTPEIKNKFKKISILSNSKILDVINEKKVTRKIKKIRSKAKIDSSNVFVQYSVSNVLTSSLKELKTCENMFCKISSQKTIEKLVVSWSVDLQKSLKYILHIVTGEKAKTIGQNKIDLKPDPSMKIVHMRSNVMKKYKDISEMKLKRSSNKIGESVSSVDGATTIKTKDDKKLIKVIPRRRGSRVYSSNPLHKVQKEQPAYTFSRDEVTQICEEYQNQDLKLLVYLQKIDTWQPDSSVLDNLRSHYNDYINVARMHLKTKVLTNKEIIPYLQRCARSLDALALMKKGMSIVYLAKISYDLQAICDEFSSPQLSETDIIYMTAIYSFNDGLFVTFLILEEVFALFSDFEEMVTSRYSSNISFLRRTVWKFIELLSTDFADKCREAIKNSSSSL